jgi:hypothetical protein
VLAHKSAPLLTPPCNGQRGSRVHHKSFPKRRAWSVQIKGKSRQQSTQMTKAM